MKYRKWQINALSSVIESLSGFNFSPTVLYALSKNYLATKNEVDCIRVYLTAQVTAGSNLEGVPKNEHDEATKKWLAADSEEYSFEQITMADLNIGTGENQNRIDAMNVVALMPMIKATVEAPPPPKVDDSLKSQ